MKSELRVVVHNTRSSGPTLFLVTRQRGVDVSFESTEHEKIDDRQRVLLRAAAGTGHRRGSVVWSIATEPRPV